MRSDRTHRRTRWKATAVAFTLVLALLGGLATTALAQVPATAELYGVHETVVPHPVPTGSQNPFSDIVLNATFQGPSGPPVNFWGFYDGDGAGGMVGTVWKIRFMPTAVGNWTVSWSFSDGAGSGSGGFSVSDTGIPGPAKLDPTNPKLLVDARGNPIHWRGYSIKHLGNTVCCNPVLDHPDPNLRGLQLEDGTRMVQLVIEPLLIQGGYNATYVDVPTGWADGTCSFASMTAPPPNDQLDCPLWGNYTYYSIKAGHVFDTIIKRLHQARIWTIAWDTFGIHATWGTLRLASKYEPFMRYFVARYGAYYNYFMWSPMWEMWELPGYVADVNAMMSYLRSIDPQYLDIIGTQRRRLQGVHDQVQVDFNNPQLNWAAQPAAGLNGWQRILPRQRPSRTIFDGNNRTTGVYSGPAVPTDPPLGVDYPNVIIGAEDLWEFCDGAFGKPTNATEVRRGLVGGLLANVLPMYDELAEDHPPCSGLANGAGEGIYKSFLNWWYANVSYRNPAFTMLNNLTGAGQRLSGIPGQEYVLYREGAGNITIDLNTVPATSVFNVWAIDAVNGTTIHVGTVNGGVLLSAPSPFPNDTLVLLRKI